MLPRCPVRVVELDELGRWVRDCAPGEKGHLVLGGDTVTFGYLDEAQNAGFFVTGVPAPGRWIDTGDLGLLDEDGYVYVSGRAKDLIIRGGHNIDPKQIEDALSRHPDVHLAAAVGRPDRTKGELPIAYVELIEGASVTADALMAFCRDQVQEKAAAPVDVVVVGAMPVTPVGKIAKPALRRMALEDEVRAAVSTAVPRVLTCDVTIDETGARKKVFVTLHPAGSEPVDLAAMEKRMIGYEFQTTLTVAPG